MEKWFIEITAKQWLKGIIRQGNRLLESSNIKHSISFESQIYNKDELDDLRDWIRVEEHFFVIAVGKACDWLNDLKDADIEYRENIDEFLKAIPHGRDIRNMREHDDAYLKGEGRKQKKFNHQFNLYDGKFTGSADATSTIIINENYLIGGRLNVTETIEAADKLHQFLNTKISN